MPLTREEFIGLIRHRGYSLAAVARLWGISRSRVSQIAADSQRPGHWDYALWGLPAKTTTSRIEGRRGRLLPTLRPNATHDARKTRLPVTLSTLEVGDVWIVRESPGEHLPEGCEGSVHAISIRDGRYHASLRFPATGYEEAFLVSFLQQPECFLSATGRNVLKPSSNPPGQPLISRTEARRGPIR